MVRSEDLTSVLSEFARTMLTDFQVQGILDRLVERIVQVLGVTGVGVTLISAGLTPRYVAASSALALRLERLQTASREGPCLTAYETGEPVVVPDLGEDDLYPSFGPAARAAGLAAVFAFPLSHGSARLGALDIYRDRAGSLDPDEMAAAQTLADVTAAYLVNAEARAAALAASDRFRESSLHDPMTGLANRVLLQERIAHAALRAGRSRTRTAIFFIDLDRFKRVNDLYGHAVGDGLLQAVAARLASMIRPGDTLARVSGDEFVILCEDVASVAAVEQLAARIVDGFDAPFVVQGRPIDASASVGVAYSEPGVPITTELMDHADTAMYRAKRSGGKTFRLLDPHAAAEGRAQDDLVRALGRALHHDRLDLAYQPIVQLADGLVVGLEALLRWRHPATGLIPAPVAVEIAEQNALITDLGRWVLERACRDRVQWLADFPGLRPLDLTVNVAAPQLLHPGFVDTVRSVLDSTGLDPSTLILDVTEGVIVKGDGRARRVMSDLKDLGVRLALDDFGSSYGTLSNLSQFPFDLVKVDQCFVANLEKDPASAAIVAAIANLGHVLDLRVLAEGVATVRQREAALRLGCDLAQGFHFARPRSSRQVASVLASDPPVLPRRRARAG